MTNNNLLVCQWLLNNCSARIICIRTKKLHPICISFEWDLHLIESIHLVPLPCENHERHRMGFWRIFCQDHRESHMSSWFESIHLPLENASPSQKTNNFNWIQLFIWSGASLPHSPASLSEKGPSRISKDPQEYWRIPNSIARMDRNSYEHFHSLMFSPIVAPVVVVVVPAVVAVAIVSIGTSTNRFSRILDPPLSQIPFGWDQKTLKYFLVKWRLLCQTFPTQKERERERKREKIKGEIKK